MNKDIAMQWATALESGEYQQARSQLRTDYGMCCLGVLCDLHAKATGGAWVQHGDNEWFYDGAPAVTPPAVASWCGGSVHMKPSALSDEKCLVTLAEMNDSGSTFTEIAAYIRENWQSL